MTDHRILKLKEGVSLEIIKDKKFKTNTVSVSFLTGEGRRAAADAALLSSVLSRSCAEYPTLKALNGVLDELYDAQLNSDVIRYGLTHTATFSVSMLDNRYSLDGTDITGGTLDVLYNILFTPDIKDGAFDADIFNNEKQQLKDAVNGIKNSRGSYAVLRCLCEMMKYEPDFAPRLGFISDIDGADPASLYTFYRDMISSAPVFMTAVISDGEDRVLDFAEKAADMLGDRKQAFIKEAKYKAPRKRLRRVTEEMPIKQDVVCVGCGLDASSDDGRDAARALFNEILFQNPTSRLFENVREKLALCYYCTATQILSLKKYIIYAGTDKKNANKTANEMISQLSLMKDEVTEDELNRCRLSLKNDLLSVLDSPSRLKNRCIARAVNGKGPEDITDFIDRLSLVKTADIEDAASVITPDTLFRLKGGDADEI